MQYFSNWRYVRKRKKERERKKERKRALVDSCAPTAQSNLCGTPRTRARETFSQRHFKRRTSVRRKIFFPVDVDDVKSRTRDNAVYNFYRITQKKIMTRVLIYPKPRSCFRGLLKVVWSFFQTLEFHGSNPIHASLLDNRILVAMSLKDEIESGIGGLKKRKFLSIQFCCWILLLMSGITRLMKLACPAPVKM